MLVAQNLFQQYLRQNNITFEDYEKWFKSLKVGDYVCRNLARLYSKFRIDEIKFYYPPDEKEVSQIKQNRGIKMLQAKQKEYPAIEIKDIRAGDLVEDPFGNRLVSCGEYLYNKNGIRECFKKELKYKLIQKKNTFAPQMLFSVTMEFENPHMKRKIFGS